MSPLNGKAGKTHSCYESLTHQAKERTSQGWTPDWSTEGLGKFLRGRDFFQGLLSSPTRLRENHAAGCRVWEAAAQGNLAWGGVRERPGAAQGPVPGLLLLRPAGGHIPGSSLLQPGAGVTLTPPSPTERHSAEQPHCARDAGLHGAAGHPWCLQGLHREEGACCLSSRQPGLGARVSRLPSRGIQGCNPGGFAPPLPSLGPFLPFTLHPF